MILAIIFVFTAAVVYYLHKWQSVWRYSEQFPGPRSLPIFGNSLQMGSNSYDFLQNMMKYVKKYDFKAFRLWLGSSLYVVITDPKDVEILLSTQKHNDKSTDYRFLYDWIGTGLISSNGKNWFRQRRTITPTFHFNILRDFHITMSSNLDRLIEKLNGYADSGESFDVQHLINMATLDVICETAMGVKINALDDHDSELVNAFHDASDMVIKRTFSSWKRFDLLYPLSEDYRTHTKAVNTLRSFNQTIITQRKDQLVAELNNNTKKSSVVNDDAPKKQKAFLDMLLTASVDGVPLTDNEINDEVATFMFAGHDTTAAAIAFGLYSMSIHPTEQQNVYNEQVSIFGEDLSRKATYQELQDMRYTEMFAKESQRMYPAVPMIARTANEGLVLSDGRKVPAGTSVSIVLFAMGHNPRIFENPEVFDPNRFLPENRASKNAYEYVPFSAGARNCIGQKFATNELRLVLSHIVRHFEVLPPAQPFKPLFAATATTHSDSGIWIRLKRRVTAKK